MARKGKLIHLLEYAALKAALGFFGAMSLDRASDMGGRIARRIGPRLPFTETARENIALAMPELSGSEREKIVADMWENLGRTIAEYAHLPVFARPEERHRIEVVHAEMLRALAASGNGGIFVSGHFANWEILPLVMQLEGLEGGGVYRHANNPYVNDWMVTLRERATQVVQVPKGPQGARTLVKLLREDKFIAMLVDQKMNDGVEAKLFGLRAMTTPAPAGLAVRYNVPIVPACVERVKGASFRITVYNPITAKPGADPVEDTLRMTQELNDFLEARIRERPHEWLWLHSRWTKQKKTRRGRLAG
ncbi:MAG: lauroyl acyltransferase [Parvibaculum sp.]|jgi:KDO2-lipid IV(A) lauroyltransferase|uniref:lysophospholipid acyltransferase family protein n=1 Tax=Parvibaculum sp. TaxID=2024848 RepID=UPI000C5A70F0|nr:lysophospholipid acyltransferase family protein [Parvibaculum sp.]HAC57204.1 lauroyl acyltransferase [Rhodobiaceae bacterium]MAU61992.1 lauroyl acyltransferase [Parvibaculum sp.]MBO6666884.1 lysophospholipid acyltransferase family protein [Parvibaculum sp.]MBO6691911.1 lysophospholipid acyltransferase family protein [Parvibaculum sp.]MBO6713505.1 lysophospholipid acyltransferase family protein [Parvibaculum sp.]|tara:strand:- start:1735 stop:2652 length:918 start_codon:yes stop_codon:yes gene_type:complete